MDALTLGTGIVLSALAALIPTILYILVVYWLDRYEKEPLALLAAAFLWGAVPAILGALLLELVLAFPLMAGETCLGCQIIESSAIAPIVEEVLKAGALFGLLLFFRQELDGVLDGIIYGALIGFGFAMTENFLYFLGSYLEGGLRGLLHIVLLRGGVFGANHALFTAVTGAGVGYARVRAGRRNRWRAPLLGLAGAIILHGAHNFGVSLALGASAGIALSLINAAGAFLLMLAVVTWALGQERGWLIEELRDEVGSTITQNEYEVITRRRSVLARRAGPLACVGGRRKPLLNEVARLATDLAFKKHRLRTGADSEARRGAIVSLRDQIANLRETAASGQCEVS